MFAVAWMVGTFISFCAMAVAARELSGDVSVFQMLFFRSAIGLLCIAAILGLTTQRAGIHLNRVGLHGLRNVFHFAGQYGWFLGIGLLPLAEVFALEFTVPMWTLLVAAVALQERITARKLTAVVLGLVGVLVIAQPGYAILDPAAFIVLAAAVCYAVAHTCTKSLSRTEPAISILFYMCVIQLPIALVLSLPGWQWPVGREWLWLAVIGITALTAHYCMAKAMLYAEVTTVVTLDFFRLPLIAIVGVLLYHEPFEISLLLGGLLMLSGNLISLQRMGVRS
tara:strand:+ start:2507 stop:3349 length:843 start_codon:yes stop_codon:yes gene_type:complete